jgi:hypothetical protein
MHLVLLQESFRENYCLPNEGSTENWYILPDHMASYLKPRPSEHQISNY